jgi:hypothetical protein
MSATTTVLDDAFDAIVVNLVGDPEDAPATDREQALAALAANHRYLRDGAGGLFRLEELDPVDTSWDGSAPLIRSRGTIGRIKRLSRVLSTAKAVAKLQATVFIEAGAQIFVGGLMKKRGPKGFVVAGGCLSTALLGTYEYGDIDMFLIGLTADEALEYIKQLGAFLSVAASGSGAVREKRLDVFRTQNCITFRVGQSLVQVILRLYGSVSELLHGFDLGSSAVAFDGEEFLFTSAGKFAYERIANVADPSRRRDSYERRLEKYSARGFGVVFPDLEKSRLLRSDVLERPTLRIENPVLQSAAGGRHYHAYLRARGSGASSDYCSGIQYADLSALALKNLECARVDPVRVAGLCGWAPYSPDLDVTQISATFVGLAGALKRAACRTSAKIARLERALGAKATTTLVTALAHGRVIDFEMLASSLVESARGHAAIPFGFMPPTNSAADPLKGGMSAADWYGAYYAAGAC